MAEAEIPVDLLNPGQIFACLGLMEASDNLHRRPCEGGFVYETGETNARFRLQVEGDGDPIKHVVSFLSEANATAIAPNGANLSTAKWGVPTKVVCETYPAPAPDSPASLAIVLSAKGLEIPVEHWLDGRHNGRDNVKFWAGAGGYPGAALARDALAIIAALGPNAIAEAAANPFGYAAPMTSSFRFDWRRDYVPLDAGFSLNQHGAMTTIGYPFVELLAAIGLQNARPQRPDPRDKLIYRYSISSAMLPTAFARAVLGCANIGFPIRTFRMRLDWPGQEGQARCIVEAREEEYAQ
jgi:CRISPR-associated protein Csx14